MYTAIDLSKYIVSKCSTDNYPISNLQLQKILYYIQKDYLIRDSIAFPDEIEAWQFGPVVPNVYYQFCGYGSMPITSTYTTTTKISAEDAIIIDKIVEEKRVLDPWQMVEETHKKDGAWDQVYQNGLGNHKIIPRELIKKAG